MKETNLSQEWKISIIEGQEIEVISPAPRREWREICDQDPHSLVAQTPEWIDSLTSSTSWQDASRLYRLSNGRKLVMPMVKRFGFLPALTVMESPPNGWGMGGVLAPGGVTARDIAVVMNDLANQPFLYTSIRPNPLTDGAWAAGVPEGTIKIPRHAHVLDLEGGFQKVWEKRFKSNARQNVRHAERAGVTVECDTTGRLVPAYYEMFLQSIERWAAQQNEPLFLAKWRNTTRDPLHKFQTLPQQIGDSFRLWMAFLDGQPVAGILVLRGVNASYTKGAMNKELAGPVRANDLLHKMAIEDACNAGCHYYHMGESTPGGSLTRFKEHFGAQPQPYAEYRLERLPVTQVNTTSRQFVKKLIGFKDA